MKQRSILVKYRRHYISLIALLVIGIQAITAQDNPKRTRVRPSAADSVAGVSNLTERARIKNEEESKNPAHIVWERIIYRTVDLTKYNNAALYYPVQPVAERQNLFTLIFKLLADGKIAAYTYSENEVFTEAQKVDFEEALKKYQIMYTKQGNRFVVDERDIPSPEVTQYMIKEGYSFDQATGTFKTSVTAICPILVREDFYYGGSSKEALFWLKYDDIRPYLSREMIMTSNYNNALTYTMDDYFRKNMYTGDIVKTVNMMGKSLAEEVGNDTIALKQAQDSIESQLKVFDQKLWVYNDSVRLAAEKEAQDKKATKSAKKTSARSKQSSANSSTEKKEKKEKEPKSSSPAKESTAPKKSVRRR